jgi:hypothetical protein
VHRPLPRGRRQWRRLLKGRAADLAMRTPLGVQPERLRRRMHWSVRIVHTRSPWEAHTAADRPTAVVDRAAVTDRHAAFVADPFLLHDDGTWHLFVEVQDRLQQRGVIGLATSTDTVTWHWRGIVLDEPFHLSYPFVFRHDGELYLIPEATEAGAVRLYRAVDGPAAWRHERDLVTGRALVDATPVRHGGRWYLFVETSEAQGHDELCLYHADDLHGAWTEHPASPLVDGDPSIARPAGRVWQHGDGLYRLAQDCTTDYGVAVVARRITRLTPDDYAEEHTSVPVLGPRGTGWRRNGMHHIDAHPLPSGDWLVAVDGW